MRSQPLSVCEPPTTTCTGFKASSTQPALKWEWKAIQTDIQEKGRERKKNKVGSSLKPSFFGRYKKSVYQTNEQNRISTAQEACTTQYVSSSWHGCLLCLCSQVRLLLFPCSILMFTFFCLILLLTLLWQTHILSFLRSLSVSLQVICQCNSVRLVRDIQRWEVDFKFMEKLSVLAQSCQGFSDKEWAKSSLHLTHTISSKT